MLNFLTWKPNINVSDSLADNLGENEPPKVKPLLDILIDSVAVAAVAAFSMWAGTVGSLDILAALKAFGVAFAIQLVYERGVKKAL